MIPVLAEGWVWWAAALAIGVPLVLVALTEIIGVLRRRRNPAVRPLLLLRNAVVPVAALVALLAFATRSDQDLVWVRIVGTMLGFLLILLVLSGVNVALFSTAREGTWRERVPTIFVEIVRLLLVVVGLAVLFQVVWNADIEGLIATLGVTSIIVGLALQNAAGGIVSGLLVLFEQPFKLGDWIETDGASGRVVEVNWRALHIDTGSGLQVIPNATLAGASFRNLSRPAGPFVVVVPVAFAPSDAPHEVAAVLRRTADDMPMRIPERPSAVQYGGSGAYTVEIPVAAPSQSDETVAEFFGRLWYAARRHGLSLDKVGPDDAANEARVRAAVEVSARALHLDDELRTAALSACTTEQYAPGEYLGRAGAVPSVVCYLVEGSARLTVPTPRGDVVCGDLREGEFVGTAAVTREPALVTAVAAAPTTLLVLPVDLVARIIRAYPMFASELGADMELRRAQVERALRDRPPVPASG
ncbi:small-conductance mechanosensitive channel [Microbacterium sp. AG790]|uniref:mechanosensitive ion channel domain-containing protein n=1 Tax=Microbacterium sp. AG790 TaxID=2183995 RepID=UPI000EAD5ACE|nr:mechanosensitive ion channel family protein [Microbacterium sp. AG790]RKS85694.1 small-conductance mechanosensitive channel [Microbacterium sp. AG790]